MRFLLAALLALPAAARAAANGAASYDWPVRDVPVVIMNTAFTLQDYGGKPGFHHGLDIQEPAGTPVYAPVGGPVKTDYYYPRYPSPYTFEIVIKASDGFTWQFHHLDPATVPPALSSAARDGASIPAGTLLGRIFDAASMGIPPHVHVNVIGTDGHHDEPLRFFSPLPDNEAPVIDGVYRDDDELVVDARDFIPPSKFAQTPYELDATAEIQAGGTRRVVALGPKRFDRLPGEGADFFTGVADAYRLDPLVLPDGRKLVNQIETDRPRRFLFRFPLGAALEGRGARTVRVHVVARDYAGNSTEKDLSFEVPK